MVFGEHGIREATGTLVNYINNLPEPIYTRSLSPSLHAAAGTFNLNEINYPQNFQEIRSVTKLFLRFI